MARNSEEHKDKTDNELIDYIDLAIIKSSSAQEVLTNRGAFYEFVRRYEKAIGRKLT